MAGTGMESGIAVRRIVNDRHSTENRFFFFFFLFLRAIGKALTVATGGLTPANGVLGSSGATWPSYALVGSWAWAHWASAGRAQIRYPGVAQGDVPTIYGTDGLHSHPADLVARCIGTVTSDL